MASHSDKKPGTTSHNFLNKPEGEPFFKSKNNALPEQLQQNLETSFNQDFSGVDIQKNSGRAEELNALAFAEGETIHFAPGQFDTSSAAGQNLIGHEFAHVVQQRQGSVQPTGITGSGTMLNDDAGLEREAGIQGERAVASNNNSSHRSTALGMRSSLAVAQAKGNVAQFAKLTSHYGEWHDDVYSLTSSGIRRGVDMTLRFKPNANVDAEQIGLTQTLQNIHNGSPFFLNSDPFYKGKAISSANAINNPKTGQTDEATYIDNLKEYNNPIYTVSAKNSASLDDSATDPSYGQHGFHFLDPATKTLKEQDAKLIDSPGIGSVDVSKDSAQIFETTALATKGAQAGTYYGSVQWGWRTNSAGKHSKIPFKVISEGVPTSTFIKAGEGWNASKTSKGKDTIDLPLPDVKLISLATGVDIGMPPMVTHLPKGTRVVELPAFVSMVETMIRVVDGPFIGHEGTVPNSALSDERN